MASSTTIPSTTMSAAIDTWCSSMPKAFSSPKVAEMVTGIATAETSATRNGSSSYGHDNHRCDGYPELADKVLHALGDNRGLVRNEIDLQIGRQQRTQAIQRSVKLLAEVHDVVAFLHLHREQNGAFAS